MSTSTLTRTRFPSAALVAVGLAVGFGVAQGTGVRALGGAVFALAGLGAAWVAVSLVTISAAGVTYAVADRPRTPVDAH